MAKQEEKEVITEQPAQAIEVRFLKELYSFQEAMRPKGETRDSDVMDVLTDGSQPSDEYFEPVPRSPLREEGLAQLKQLWELDNKPWEEVRIKVLDNIWKVISSYHDEMNSLQTTAEKRAVVPIPEKRAVLYRVELNKR